MKLVLVGALLLLASPAMAGINHGLPVSIPPTSVPPCDVLQTAGTPCVAAHSLVRRMYSAYAGNLFQIQRASDSATLNITSGGGTGLADISGVPAFCAATVCGYSIVYDQSGNSNDLTVGSTAHEAVFATDTMPDGTVVPIMVTTCNSPCTTTANNPNVQAYRKRSGTVGIPTGNASITVYAVASNRSYSVCCGFYGNVEASLLDTGPGHMFELSYSSLDPAFAQLNPPQVGIDREDGLFSFAAAVPSRFTLLAKHTTGANTTVVKLGTAMAGALTTLQSGADPVSFAMEGGLTLGEGGDASPSPMAWYEGAVIAAATSDATDTLLQTSVTSFYGPVPAGAVCAQSTAYLARVSASMQPTEQAAAANLICGLVGDGIWSTFDVFYLLANSTSADALLNLVSASFPLTITGTELFFPDSHFEGNGNSPSALHTGYTPGSGNYNLTSAAFGVYLLNDRNFTRVSADIGSFSASQPSDFFPRTTGNLAAIDMNVAAPGVAAVAVQGNWVLSRTGTTTANVYRNESIIPVYTSSTASVSIPTHEFLVGATTGGGGTGFAFSQDWIAAAFIGGGLTAGQAVQLQNRINTYMRVIGANVY